VLILSKSLESSSVNGVGADGDRGGDVSAQLLPVLLAPQL
jgi:hypothetical protein